MLGFRALPLGTAYDSGSADADVVADFYVPVLAEASSYDRLAGFFSSAALAVAARGVAGLIRNEGKIRLVTSPNFTRKDLDVLRDLPAAERDAFLGDVLCQALRKRQTTPERSCGWMT